MCWFPTPSINKFDMGNNSSEGIPRIITKNWAAVTELPNTYRNRLTGQFAHKHIVVVEDGNQLPSFRERMKEDDQSICRVLFYHHHCDNIYHVYTDQMLPLTSSRPEHHVQILQAFERLMGKYGCMRICEQMIGLDGDGKIKVWINANPVSPYPWNPCHNEKQMVSDLIVCLHRMSIDAHTLGQNFPAFKQVSNFRELKMLYQAKTTKISNVPLQAGIGKKNQKKLKKVFKPMICETSRNQQFYQKNPKLHNSFRNKEMNLKNRNPGKGTYRSYLSNYSEYQPFQPASSRFQSMTSNLNQSLEKKGLEFHNVFVNNSRKTEIDRKGRPVTMLQQPDLKEKRVKSEMPLAHMQPLRRYTESNENNAGIQNIPNRSQKESQIDQKIEETEALKSEMKKLLGLDEEEQNCSVEGQKQLTKDESDRMFDKQESHLIKKRVEKKKATFANLKSQAMKILQNDF